VTRTRGRHSEAYWIGNWREFSTRRINHGHVLIIRARARALTHDSAYASRPVNCVGSRRTAILEEEKNIAAAAVVSCAAYEELY